MPDSHFIYSGGPFPDPGIKPLPYQAEFFKAELALESALFEDLRRAKGIEPARLDQSSPEELEGIRAFFNEHAQSFFFLFDEDGRLIGSILYLGRYIQCLAVDRAYQGRGWGRKLAAYAVNRILAQGPGAIELDVMEGNDNALAFWRALSFTERT